MANVHVSFMIIMQYIMDRFPENVRSENVWSA